MWSLHVSPVGAGQGVKMGTRNLARVIALAGIVLTCIWGVVGTASLSPSAAEAAFAVSENGTINVDSNVTGARFSIDGVSGANNRSTPAEFSDVPPGSYTIVWQEVTGYSTPGPETKEITEAGSPISFYGNYEAILQTGTIVVTANVPGATFNISGTATYNGAPRTINNAPAGSYTIVWGEVSGYTKPGNQSLPLTAGNAITFNGVYTEAPVLAGTITVTSIPAGATFSITGTALYSGIAPATYNDAAPGSYTITWGPMLGLATPLSETRVLAAGSGISFLGNYGSDAAGPVVSGVSASSVTADAATITWTTDEPADSQVQYGASTNYGPATPVNPTLTTGHSVTLTGLVYGTLYHYRVISKDALGNSTTSGDYTFTTIDNIPPAISGVAVTDITPNTATVTWTTNEKSDSMVEYGLTIAFGSSTLVDTRLVTSHKVTITGLTPATWYYYRVVSKDQAGNPMQSERFDFLTADKVPPVISSVIVTDISESGMTVNWETDERSDSQVEYGLTANYGSITTVDSTLVRSHSVVLTGLKAQTVYHFRVISADYWGNSSRSPDGRVTTTDVDAPIISGVAATAITDTSAIIVWFTDAASESSVEYGVSTNYGLVSAYDNTMVTSHSVALPDLMAQTTYHYKVKSRDTSGIWSETPDYTFTTGIDMGTDPPKILYLTPGEPTSSGTTISWSTNELAISQIEYGMTEKYGTSTAPSTDFKTLHVVQLTGLKAGMTYHYRVICTDAAGNRSVSEDKTFNTPMGRAPLPSLPTWAWALVGVAGILVVGVLVVKNR